MARPRTIVLPPLKAQYMAGDTISNIARDHGISYWTARVRLLEEGVELRPIGVIPKTHAEMLEEKTDKSAGPDACWIFTGLHDGYGYGLLQGRAGKNSAHRVSWETANNRKIPKGMCICHRCDNPPCVNPKHLFLGTRADNQRDMASKGRWYSAKRLASMERRKKAG